MVALKRGLRISLTTWFVVFVMILLRQLMINCVEGLTGDTAAALIEITDSVSLIMFILELNLM